MSALLPSLLICHAQLFCSLPWRYLGCWWQEMETRGGESGDISKGWSVCFQAPNKGHRKAEISSYQSLNWTVLRVSPISLSRVFLLPLCHCWGFQMTAWGPCWFQGSQPLRDCERSHKNTVLANLKVRSPVEHFWSWKQHCLNAVHGMGLSWCTWCFHMLKICLLGKKHFLQHRQGHRRSQPNSRLLQAPGTGC